MIVPEVGAHWAPVMVIDRVKHLGPFKYSRRVIASNGKLAEIPAGGCVYIYRISYCGLKSNETGIGTKNNR